MSTRARFMLTAALAAVPLIALVAFSSLDRYGADRERAETRAVNRAELFSTLLAEEDPRHVPSQARLRELMALNELPAGSATVVFRDGREIARSGPVAAGPPMGMRRTQKAIASRDGVFSADGSDGVRRVWGFKPVGDGPLTIAFGIPGSAIYGPTRDALERDLLLALLAAVAALGAAFLIAGHVTAPIRRLALKVGGDGDSEIGRIERRFAALGVKVEESATELARRADRIAALRTIDRAILDAETPEDIARAALGRLRSLVDAALAEVVLFDRERGTATPLVVDNGRSPVVDGPEVPLDGPLFRVDALDAGKPVVHDYLDAIAARSPRAQALLADDVGSYLCVPLAAEGRLLGTVGIGFTATGRPAPEALVATAEVADQLAIALRHARLHAELQAVVEAAVDGIVVLDADRRLISANRAAREFLGSPRNGDLTGRRLDEIATFTPGLDSVAARRTGGAIEGIFSVVLPSGDTRQVEIRGRADFQRGRDLLLVRDVTDRRRLEDQLRQAQKMEAVGQLAGGVAHDFNNLLTVISGYGEIARRRIGSGPGGAELDEIGRAAERATQLTRQLLAFSRQQVLEPALLDLNEVLGALLPMLGRLIGDDVEIALLTDEELPPVLVDRAQLEQVIINLAINGRDAMPTGGTITIETRAAELTESYARDHAGVFPGHYARLMVTDTGTGMERSELEHIFEPFFTTKNIGQGTGLGLAMVHGVVTQSGGHVHVYSEPGLGTSFKIYLPAAGEAPVREEKDAGAEPERLAGTETVLLCEDEDLVRDLIDRILTEHGYRVLSSAGPVEALEALTSGGREIDLLITDVIMPQMSGPELAERIMALRPGLRTLFLSGYTSETVRSRGNLPPGSAFLEKPFDHGTLLRTVRSLLDGEPQPSRDGAGRRTAG